MLKAVNKSCCEKNRVELIRITNNILGTQRSLEVALNNLKKPRYTGENAWSNNFLRRPNQTIRVKLPLKKCVCMIKIGWFGETKQLLLLVQNNSKLYQHFYKYNFRHCSCSVFHLSSWTINFKHTIAHHKLAILHISILAWTYIHNFRFSASFNCFSGLLFSILSSRNFQSLKSHWQKHDILEAD